MVDMTMMIWWHDENNNGITLSLLIDNFARSIKKKLAFLVQIPFSKKTARANIKYEGRSLEGYITGFFRPIPIKGGRVGGKGERPKILCEIL